MNKILAMIGLGVAALTCTAALADGGGGSPYYYAPAYPHGLYAGVSAGELVYREDGIDTLRPGFAEFRLGQEFNRYLALEGRVGGGLGSDQSSGFRTNVQALYAGYVKGALPMTPWLAGYALVGVAGVQLRRNYPDFNGNDAGFSGGIGAELKVGGGASVTLEWVRLMTGTNDRFYDYTADQIALGVNWHW